MKRFAPIVFLFLLACSNHREKPITKITFGSCAFQWDPQPIWNSISAQKPDLFLFLGDAIYGDWDGENVYEVTAETFDRDWGKLAVIPEFEAFRKQVPILATWDNHDYGKHNGGADFPKKELAKQKFLDFFDEPQDSKRRNTPGIYDSKIYGPEGKRVQIILLDTKWWKSPFKPDTLTAEQRVKIGKVGKYIGNNDLGATQLGEVQWKWLEEQLSFAAEVRFICSGTQVIPVQKGMDEWGCYPKDRERLFEFIHTISAGNTFILSGNVHFGELSTLDWKGTEIFDLTSSGMTHIEEKYGKAANRYRIGEPYIGLNFGMVEIDWEKSEVLLTIHDMEGFAKVGKKVKL